MCTYCATRLKNALGVEHTISMTSLTQLFYGRKLPSLALLSAHVSLSFSLDVQMNMLQVSSYTGQNPRTTKKASKTNWLDF